MKFIILFILFLSVFISFYNAKAQSWGHIDGPYGGYSTLMAKHPNDSSFIVKSHHYYNFYKHDGKWNNSLMYECDKGSSNDICYINGLVIDEKVYIYTINESSRFRINYSTDIGRNWLEYRRPDIEFFGSFTEFEGNIYSVGYLKSQHKYYGILKMNPVNNVSKDIIPPNPNIMFYKVFPNGLIYAQPWPSSEFPPRYMLYRTTDEGATWEQLNAPFKDLLQFSIKDIIKKSDNEFFALVNDSSIYKSIDGGRSFIKFYQDSSYLTRLQFFGKNNEYIFATDEFHYTNENSGHINLIKTDGSEIKKVNLPYLGLTSTILNNEEIVVCLKMRGVFSSNDTGRTWTHIGVPNEGYNIRLFEDSKGLLLASTQYTGLVRYKNDNLWDNIDGRFDLINKILELDNYKLAIFTSDKLFVTNDLNRGFKEIPSFTEGQILIDAVFCGNGSIVGYFWKGDNVNQSYDIYKSTDNGENWKNITRISGSNFGKSFVKTNVFLKDGYYLHYSKDAGNSWDVINDLPVKSCQSVSGDPHSGFQYSYGPGNYYIYQTSKGTLLLSLEKGIPNWGTIAIEFQLYRSSDYGKNWELVKKFNNGIGSMFMDANSKDEVFVFDNNALYKSSDDGITWEKVLDKPLAERDYYTPSYPIYQGMIIGPTDKLYLNTDYYGIYTFDTNPGGNIAPLDNINIFPNPSYGDVKANVISPKAQQAIINIYNVLGSECLNIFNGELTSGQNYFTFDSNKLPIGFYFLQVRTNFDINVLKIIVTH